MVCFICSFSKFGRFVLFRAVFARLGLGRVFFTFCFGPFHFGSLCSGAEPAVFRSVRTGSPQPPVVAEIFCSKLDVADVGSPQPPPGGGLLLYVAGPSARLRARFSAMPLLLGCGLALRLESTSKRSAGYSRPPPGGGLLLYVADPSARLRARFSAMPLLFGRGLALRLESTSKRSAGRSLPAAEARSSLPNLLALRRLRPNSNS